MKTVLRTETQKLRRGERGFDAVESCAYASNSLWNYANFLIRERFFGAGEWLRYGDVDKLVKTQNAELYRRMPAQTAQQTL